MLPPIFRTLAFLAALCATPAHALTVEVEAPDELKPLLNQYLEAARAARLGEANRRRRYSGQVSRRTGNPRNKRLTLRLFFLGDLPPEGGDLDHFRAEPDVRQAEPPPDDETVPEEFLDLARVRARADVEVFRPTSENQVADAAADEVCDVAVLLQAIEHPQRVRVDIPARNRMVFARNDYRFGHEG